MSEIDWTKMDGVVPTILQEEDGTVLTLVYSTKESLEKARQTNEPWYYSRSRKAVVRKGLTSGNTQELLEIRADCDNDALLFVVRQKGAACHSGDFSCFGKRKYTLQGLFDTILQRRDNPQKGSYTSSLFTDPKGALNKTLEKVGEETTELIIAAKEGARVKEEMADLLYFCIVLLVCLDIPWQDVIDELRRRQR